MNNEIYIQRELGTAAYMIARGCEYVGLHSIGGNMYAFQFKDDGQCSDIAQGYWRDEVCPGSKLISALRYLKTQLSDAKTTKNRGRQNEYPRTDAHHNGPTIRK